MDQLSVQFRAMGNRQRRTSGWRRSPPRQCARLILLRDEIGPIRLAPCRHVVDQALSLSNAMLRGRFVDIIARVLRYVA